MKRNLKILLFLLLPCFTYAQQKIDSLKNDLTKANNDSLRYKAGRELYNYFEEKNRDSGLYYAEQLVLLAEKDNQKIPQAYSLVNKAYQLIGLGRFGDALQCLQKSFSIVEDPKNGKRNTWPLFLYNFIGQNDFTGDERLLALSYTHHMFALLMVRTENIEQQIFHFKEAAKIGQKVNWLPRVMLADMNLGQSYLTINKPDSALFFETEAERLSVEINYKKYLGNIEVLMGDIHQALKHSSLALQYYYKGIQFSVEQNNLSSLSRNYLRLIKYHLAYGNKDSALYYSRQNLQTILSLGSVTGAESNVGVGYENIYQSYQLNHQFDSAYKYLVLALVAKDSLNKLRIKNLTEFQNLSFTEQLRLKNLENEKLVYQNKVRIYLLLAGIGVLFLLATILYWSYRQKQKANKKIEKSYRDLRTTQQQLIQSEKMASLGELTAGIAHEIQNPLNFVNNFSEVSVELVDEMRRELQENNKEEASHIAADLKDNLQKITEHGKRAASIVKGMLQHSGKSAGKKELTDINALTDEYVRLSYHGLRAKDKSFNATIQTNFDENVGSIEVIPQDIGRVLFNLLNNAFYSVNEKQKNPHPLQRSPSDLKESNEPYEPIVSVNTKRLGSPSELAPNSFRGVGGKIEISVKDNGTGIPQKVLEKIYQPFFTTKPTGQGTGLGLSLSYDIITKGHGGEIIVETKEGEGTEFIVILPGN